MPPPVRNSDLNPLEAWLAGIQSGLGRIAVAWVTLTLGISVPFLSVFGTDLIRAGFLLPLYWPVGVVYGIVEWGSMPSVFPVFAVLIPTAMFAAAWAFIQDYQAGFSLWLLFTLSLLLTGPALATKPAWLVVVTAAWSLLTLGCIALGRWHRRER